MIITITGLAASGKSSVAKLLAKKIGFGHYSAGDAQREVALEKEMTISELGDLESKDDSIDRMIDERLEAVGKSKKNFVVDAWLGACFIPHAVKIFLEADIKTRVERRLGHKREEESFEDFNEARGTMEQREETNRKRWLKFYNFDYTDRKNYDYTIKTDELNQKQIADKIITILKKDGRL
ncbi:MAG: cytidylate kinase family protein [Candidatus Aenigmarchaeota archaeon]|nr:cytidylate kinase family protein [Candidatus Aenigmarchaeota archaeon]